MHNWTEKAVKKSLNRKPVYGKQKRSGHLSEEGCPPLLLSWSLLKQQSTIYDFRPINTDLART